MENAHSQYYIDQLYVFLIVDCVKLYLTAATAATVVYNKFQIIYDKTIQ